MDPRRWIGRRFERGELVGKGGAGSVYRAVDSSTGVTVALKVLVSDDPRTVERFEREARSLADLVHPHIVRYVDHGRTPEGEAYLAMEWLEGESLAARLVRGALTLRESLDLGHAVADALASAHARGVVHRDVKPSNLFLDQGVARDVRMLDFGLAQVASASRVITHTGAVIGTPGYMAPEQARGDDAGRVDARADLFSLGAVLYECLTGKRAFEGVHMMALLAQLLLAETPRVRETLPQVPPALDDLVARLLAKDPDDRPASAAEVASALAAMREGPIPARLSMAAPPPAITTQEQRLIAAIAVAYDRASTEAALAVREVARSRGARADQLSHEVSLVTLAGLGSPTVQAEAAARCALRLREALPTGATLALATGRGLATGRLPVGAVVESAAGLLAEGRVRPGEASVVRIDEVTRALLDERFVTSPAGASATLTGERAIGEGARTLLGRPTPYVGRDRELRMLLDLVTATFEGERGAQAAIVTAAPGMGKTRLRHELVKRLRAERPDVAIGTGRADAMSAGAAFVAVGAALRSAFGLGHDDAGPTTRTRVADSVAAYVPFADRARVAAFLGEITGVPFDAAHHPELAAARQNGAKMAEEVSRAFVEFLRGVSAMHPVLLVLEDLHWGDAASARLVDDALRELADRPFVVLALGRPELDEVFPDLWSRREVQRVRLGALARRAAEELVTRMLGRGVSEGEIARLVDRAGGNAFYLEELIRALAEGRGERLPETVLGMVEARLEALPAEARRLLRAASVFGESFTKAGALSLLGDEERTDAGRTWLPWLVDRELFVRRPAARAGGEDEYFFRHALLREGSYATLTAEDRALGHRLAAAFLGGPGGEVARAAVIGEHLFRAGEWLRSAEAFARTAEAASRLSANVEARAHYERALDALSRAEDTIEARRMRVDTMIQKVAVSYGDDPKPNFALLAAAQAIAADLPEAARPPSDDYRRVARVQFWRGRCHWYNGEYPQAIECYQRTLAAAQKLDDDELTALPAGTIGRVMMAQGYFGRCVPFLERALGPLSRTGHHNEWVVNTGFVGVVFAAGGRAYDAVARGEEALARALSMESLTSTSIAHTMLAGIHVFGGAPDAAAEMLQLAAEEAERAGDRVYAYLAYGFGAWASSRAGDHEEARSRMARSRAIRDELGRRLVFADWMDAFAIEAEGNAGRHEDVLALASRLAPTLRAAGSIFAEGLVQRAWGVAIAATEPAHIAAATEHLGESVLLLALSEAHTETARSRRALERLYT
ncbi:MAG: protein kinase [Polyangiaceae bacterium]